MSSSKQPNEVFEIIPIPEPGNDYGYRLKLKGKILSKKKAEERGYGFDLRLSPEDFLDFDASVLPDGFEFLMILPEHKCMDLMDMLAVMRVEDKVKLEYCFAILDNSPPDIYLNPVKLVHSFYKLVEKAEYKMQYCKSEIDSGNITVYVPAKGNLYQHYKKHFDVLEALMKQAADEMIKKILAQ